MCAVHTVKPSYFALSHLPGPRKMIFSFRNHTLSKESTEAMNYASVVMNYTSEVMNYTNEVMNYVSEVMN